MAAAALASLPPVVQNWAMVAQQPVMQMGDYWDVMERVMAPDGSLQASRVLEYQNEHLMVIPSLVYWLNYKVFDGYAWPLAIFVLAVIGATVVLLAWELSRHVRSDLVLAAGVVAISWMLFSPSGVANIGYPMSGTAWCVANLFSVAAVVSALRSRWPLALLACIAATFTYGTGLASWFAVASVAVLAHLFGDRSTRSRTLAVAWPVAAVAVTASVLASIPPHEARTEGGIQWAGRLSNVLQTAGAITRQPEVAMLLGALVLSCAVLCAWLLVEDARDPRGAGPDLRTTSSGVAFVVLGVVMCGFVGAGRSGGNDWGMSSRYASVTAMVWVGAFIAATVLLGSIASGARWSARRDRLVAVVPVGALSVAALLSFAGAHQILMAYEDNITEMERLAIAMKLGDGDGFFGTPEVSVFAPAAHVPFNGDPIGDCSLIGTEPSVAPDSQLRGTVESWSEGENDSIHELVGWLDASEDWECLVGVDPDGTVVAAGLISDDERRDARKVPGVVEPVSFVLLFPSGIAPEHITLAGWDGADLHELPASSWMELGDAPVTR